MTYRAAEIPQGLYLMRKKFGDIDSWDAYHLEEIATGGIMEKFRVMDGAPSYHTMTLKEIVYAMIRDEAKPEDGEEFESRNAVLIEVSGERDRQNQKWGKRSLHTVHNPLRALAVLAEEVGEVAEQVVEWSAAQDDAECAGTHMAHYRAELIQVAAVAVAMVQAFDRGAEAAAR